MLGTTLTLNLDGIGGTAIVMDRISDDGLSARYFKHGGTEDYQLDVRHVVDKNNISKHYLSFSQTVFATAAHPEYKTIVDLSFKANNALTSNAIQKAIVTALTDFVGATTATAGNVDKLIGLNS